jgi:hypothetical protein
LSSERVNENEFDAIVLDDLQRDNGCLQHLILAECMTPNFASYDFAKAQNVIKAMKAVVVNRKNLNKPGVFCSVGATTIVHYICAPVSGAGCQAQQFQGFSWENNMARVSAAVLNRINDALAIANSAAHPKKAAFIKHINEIISVSNTAITDPYKDIPSTISGVSVLKGAYGWRTSGSGTGGGSYIAVPKATASATHPDGDLQGIQFLAIKSNV